MLGDVDQVACNVARLQSHELYCNVPRVTYSDTTFLGVTSCTPRPCSHIFCPQFIWNSVFISMSRLYGRKLYCRTLGSHSLCHIPKVHLLCVTSSGSHPLSCNLGPHVLLPHPQGNTCDHIPGVTRCTVKERDVGRSQ